MFDTNKNCYRNTEYIYVNYSFKLRNFGTSKWSFTFESLQNQKVLTQQFGTLKAPTQYVAVHG